MPISKIYMICSAYESGVGHGVEDDKLPNPYKPGSDEYIAYGYGVAAGLEIREENNTDHKFYLLKQD